LKLENSFRRKPVSEPWRTTHIYHYTICCGIFFDVSSGFASFKRQFFWLQRLQFSL